MDTRIESLLLTLFLLLILFGYWQERREKRKTRIRGFEMKTATGQRPVPQKKEK